MWVISARLTPGNDRLVDPRPTGGPGAADQLRLGGARGHPRFRPGSPGVIPPPTSVVGVTEPGSGGPNATSDALAGSQWRIVAIDGRPVLDAEPLLVAFGHDGRVTGSTGVNRFTASYTLTAEYLSNGPLATTRRSGPPDLMAQEHRVVASLAGICPFRLSGRSLYIEGPLGRVELTSTDPLPEVMPAGPDAMYDEG